MNENVFVALIAAFAFIFTAIALLKRLLPKIFKSDKYLLEPICEKGEALNAFRNAKVRQVFLISILFMILVRALGYIPLIGINQEALRGFFVSIFSLGIRPFISANILLLLLAIAIPRLRRFSQSNPKTISYIIYVLTLFLCFIQAYFFSKWMLNPHNSGGIEIVCLSRFKFALLAMFSMSAATMFVLWLANKINKYGIGHGISLLIFGGLVMSLRIYGFQKIWEQMLFFDYLKMALSLTLIITLLYVAFWILRVKRIVMVEDRVTKQTVPLFLSVNQAGLIPATLAISLMILPQILLRFFGNALWTAPTIFAYGRLGYYILVFVVIIITSWGYGRIAFNPRYVAMKLKENNMRIKTENMEKDEVFLIKLLNKLNLIWAGFVGLFYILARIYQPMSYVFISGISLLTIAAIALGYLWTNIRHYDKKKIFTHSEIAEILVAKAYLEMKGIKAYIDAQEAYGRLYCYFIGPLARKKLLVDKEDYENALVLMKEYK